ncbi:MAG: NADH-quinone oxidoreductase subunit NuoN [Proteobacteria bacterium]|nr:NADH-quinone oxidoreductase subunit NuoN [Pseudomonadota bacterium]MDA0971169.1 NADH-quinone oxidoreductase subunit NuoN [Pseudomonadota bacterium]MDA0995430.1 NADH-quinone oxidoreductase subunit NuoN [Pseudomonadota bacterium]
MDNLNLIYPELFIGISLMVLLIVGVFKKNSFNLISKFTALSLLVAIPMVYINDNVSVKLFSNNYIIDELSSFLKILILASSAFALFFTNQYIKDNKIDQFEYPILIMSAILGMFVMVSSNNLIGLYLGIELQSLSLYVLASLNRDSVKSTEAGVKYFVLGALSSGLLLYGCSLIYGFTGSTNYYIIAENFDSRNLGLLFGLVFILIGLAFKISAVPFHMWTPDVYEGAPTSVTAFFALAPKVAGFGAIIRILYVAFGNVFVEWQIILIFISVASMILGAVAAIGQTNIKRLMAYSSISHMGYGLAGLATGIDEGVSASILYIFLYVVMKIGSFVCILIMKRKNIYFENIRDLSGLSKNHPVIAFSFTVFLFSLAGIPPLAGFFAKFYIFMAVIKAELFALAVIGLVTTVISAFYYLKIIKIIYFDPEQEKFDSITSKGIKVSLTFSTLLILFYFLNPSILNYFVNIASKAVQ